MTNINRPVIWNAQRGVVTGESASRGKGLLTIALAGGREIKARADSVEFADVEKYAAPDWSNFGKRDHYGDVRSMLRN